MTPRRLSLWARRAGMLSAGLCLTGCSGAPSRNILGSYFPSWMVCALIALAITIVVKAVFARTGIDAVLAAPLIAYMALFAAFTFAAWLLWLG
jgi:hypothetical protein